MLCGQAAARRIDMADMGFRACRDPTPASGTRRGRGGWKHRSGFRRRRDRRGRGLSCVPAVPAWR